MTLRVGIVCEGLHDLPVLRELIGQIAAENGEHDVLCVGLQPKPDATSTVSEGGWSRVIAWCKAHTGDGINTYLRTPLFEGENVFDIIVVHLDGDAVIDCAAHTSIVPPGMPCDSETRVKVVSEMIMEWLAPPAAQEAKIKKAVPTMQTESWLLAAVSANVHDWERVAAKPLFKAEFLPKGTKKAEAYARLSVEAAKKLADIRTKCRSFELFSEHLFAS